MRTRLGQPHGSLTSGASVTKAQNKLTRKERKELARELRAAYPGLEIIHPHAAGIDVGNSAHYVAVAPHRDPEPVRRFGCFTADLNLVAECLKGRGVQTVVVQSTGVYWGNESTTGQRDQRSERGEWHGDCTRHICRRA